MKLSIKNRISVHFTIATAIAFAIVYVSLYLFVDSTVISNVDSTLAKNAAADLKKIYVEDGVLGFSGATNSASGLSGLGDNGVFLQVANAKGRVVYRSQNLGEFYLIRDEAQPTGQHYTRRWSNGTLRMVETPIYHEGVLKGYLLTAVSLGPALALLKYLNMILLGSYPVVVLALLFFSRYLAGKSMKPLRVVRDTADRISKDNFNERIPLPANQDEAYDLSVSMNQLLQRVEEALQREQQYSSYVSHELRTPISVLRGTLEVLIRKRRSQQEYEHKISECLREIDQLTEVMEQLLVLARADGAILFDSDKRVSVSDIVEELVAAKTLEAELFGVELIFTNSLNQIWLVPQKHVYMILNNLIGNAIKYGSDGRKVTVDITREDSKLKCIVKDYGKGISADDIPHIFKPFFRSDSLNSDYFKGNGLGLSIAQKTAQSMGSEITVESIVGKGSTFTLAIDEKALSNKSLNTKSKLFPKMRFLKKA